MENIFVLRVILSFVIAGIWIAFSTLLAERYGSKIGGLIANLPSNILISLIFITIVNDISYIQNMVVAIPIGLIVDTAFMLAFIVLLRYNLIVSVIGSLLVWIGLAILLAGLELNNLLTNIVLFIIVTIIAIWFVEKGLKIPSMQNNRKKYSINQILFRALFGGSIVASIVVISKFCNPYFTGIFSAFPAMLLSTFVVLTLNQSKEFAMATGKVLVLSLTNILVYALLVKLTYPTLGIIIGTIVSYAGSAVWVWMLHPLVKKLN
jgi:uncharacterized membrane protein (GlpM family)